MNRRVFVDTSAWVAVANRSEHLHPEAVALYKHLLEADFQLVTSSLVLAETHILLRRKIGHPEAMMFLRIVNQSRQIQTIFPGLEVEKTAKDWLGKYHDQDFSLTDAVSFTLMQAEGLDVAFSYDRHFTVAGFSLLE
jgi:uncharacterized protein